MPSVRPINVRYHPDSVDKVLSEPLERNNRIRTASCLNRNFVRGSDFESMLRVRAHKIVFQHYRPKADKGESWARNGLSANDPGCVKTHTSGKCRKYTWHPTVCSQYYQFLWSSSRFPSFQMRP